MKSAKKSEERTLKAMKLGYELCNEGSELSWNDIAKAHKISNSFATSLTKHGIIVKKSNKLFEWIGEPPSEDLIKKLKHERNYFKMDEKTFEEKTIDDKINHLEFMLDQIFERVNYLFENLADSKTKKQIDSEWFNNKL